LFANQQASTAPFLQTLFPPEALDIDRKASLSKQFQKQLNDLMMELNVTEPHYIRCIKPNEHKSAQEFHKRMCYDQLMYSGVFEAVAIRKQGFPFRLKHSEFAERYAPILSEKPRKGQVSSITSHVLGSVDHYLPCLSIGSTRVINHYLPCLSIGSTRVINHYLPCLFRQTLTCDSFPTLPYQGRDKCMQIVNFLKLPSDCVQVGKTMMLYRAAEHKKLELERNIKTKTVEVQETLTRLVGLNVSRLSPEAQDEYYEDLANAVRIADDFR
jgi:myosin heavy subunit